MKVIIKNATGSQIEEALLDKDSGVIEFKSGEISHVLYEKQFNKSIFVVKDAPKESKPLEKSDYMEPKGKAVSVEPSKEPIKKKAK